MTHRAEFEAAVEAILFVTPEPVSVDRLLEVFEEPEREEARAALAAVRARYEGGEARGVRLEEVAGGLRIVTAPECHPFLRKFFDAAGANRLSMAALETLAIIAYRQPVTGPEIQDLRSKNSATALRTLLDRRMIRITGRKEVVGRPFLYATTRDFLMHFGLKGLSELPPLAEFEETFGGGDELVESRPAAPIAVEHEAIGLLSTEEVETTLGSASFGVHEHGGQGARSGDRSSRGGGDAAEAPVGDARREES